MPQALLIRVNVEGALLEEWVLAIGGMVVLAVEPLVELRAGLGIEPHHAVGLTAHREEPVTVEEKSVEPVDVSAATEQAPDGRGHW